MPPKVARLAGLGAFAAAGGLALLFLLFAYVTRPTARGGIDTINAVVTWISVGGLFVALIAAHVVIGRRLLGMAKGTAELP